MKYIVTWISQDKIQTDYQPFRTKKEALDFYKRLVQSDCYSVNLCKIIQSIDY